MTRSNSQSNDNKDVAARRTNARMEWQKPVLRRLASEEAMSNSGRSNDPSVNSNEQS